MGPRCDPKTQALEMPIEYYLDIKHMLLSSFSSLSSGRGVLKAVKLMSLTS